METPKIVNLLNDTDNTTMMLLMTKIMDNMVKETKMVEALNLKQKLLNQAFVITQKVMCL